MHNPALADLLGRLPAPPSGLAKQPTAPDLVSWSVGVCQPWRQGGRHGWRSLVTDSAATDEAAA